MPSYSVCKVLRVVSVKTCDAERGADHSILLKARVLRYVRSSHHERLCWRRSLLL